MSVLAIETLILGALAAAPPHANLFLTIENALLESQKASYPSSYRYQLYFLSAACGLNVFMIALGWGIKASRDRFWIISTRSGYLLPHWKFSWSTYAIIFLSLLQGLIWNTIQALDGARAKDATLWKTAVWIPAWLAGLTAAWVLGVSYILAVKSKGIEITSFFLSPAFVNFVAVAIPLLFVATIAGLTAAVAISYLDVLAIVDSAINELATSAANWDGSPLTIAQMAPELAAFAMFGAPEAVFVLRMKWMFAMLFAWAVLLAVAIATVAWLQLGVFRKVLKKASNTVATTNGKQKRNQASKVSADDELRWSLGNIIAAVTCIILADLSMAGLALWISLTAESTVFSPRGLEVSTLGSIYVFVGFALPTSAFVLYRGAVEPWSTRHAGSDPSDDESPSGGIHFSKSALSILSPPQSPHGYDFSKSAHSLSLSVPQSPRTPVGVTFPPRSPPPRSPVGVTFPPNILGPGVKMCTRGMGPNTGLDVDSMGEAPFQSYAAVSQEDIKIEKERHSTLG